MKEVMPDAENLVQGNSCQAAEWNFRHDTTSLLRPGT